MDASFFLSLILGVSGVGGGILAWSTRRFETFDARIDQLEVSVNREFIRKDEVVPMMDRLEQRVQRIDEKLDRIIFDGRRLTD